MNRFFWIASSTITVFCLFASFQLHANDLAQTHRLIYEIKVDWGITVTGTMKQDLQPSSHGKWIFQRNANVLGFKAQEMSILSFNDDTIRGYSYSKSDSGFGGNNKSSYTIHKAHIYDTLTVSLQVAIDLSNGMDIENKVYKVQTSANTFSDYRFIIGEPEQISTKLGTIDTLRIEKIEEEKGKRSIFWLMPDYHYLIAKATSLKEDDNDVTFTLKQGKIGNTDIQPR